MNQHNLPKFEILYRVLPIKYKNSLGTCFTVDASGKQYIVTAKHVVEGIEDVDEIELGRIDKMGNNNCQYNTVRARSG